MAIGNCFHKFNERLNDNSLLAPDSFPFCSKIFFSSQLITTSRISFHSIKMDISLFSLQSFKKRCLHIHIMFMHREDRQIACNFRQHPPAERIVSFNRCPTTIENHFILSKYSRSNKWKLNARKRENSECKGDAEQKTSMLCVPV